MKSLFVGILLLMGCGEVIKNEHPDAPALLQLGATCGAGTECASGSCVDGVCCDTACGGQCEACVGAKTGGADGTCTPVTANTDPDAECGTATTCGTGGVMRSTCGGAAACAMTTTSCGYFTCDSATTACRTSCTDNTSCSATGFCNAARVCAKRLRIALETSTASCTRTESLPVVKAALEARGHTATIVAGADIDDATKLANFDVVVAGSEACQGDDRGLYDAALGPWVMGGGGLVGSGWVLYTTPPANFGALMPNSGTAYLTGAQSVVIVGTHPIVAGLSAFTAQAMYLPYGGAPKAGATQLLATSANQDIAEAWAQGSGRVVFEGLLHIDSFASYSNQSLTNGTNPNSLEFFLRSIEWAGGSL